MRPLLAGEAVWLCSLWNWFRWCSKRVSAFAHLQSMHTTMWSGLQRCCTCTLATYQQAGSLDAWTDVRSILCCRCWPFGGQSAWLSAAFLELTLTLMAKGPSRAILRSTSVDTFVRFFSEEGNSCYYWSTSWYTWWLEGAQLQDSECVRTRRDFFKSQGIPNSFVADRWTNTSRLG